MNKIVDISYYLILFQINIKNLILVKMMLDEFISYKRLSSMVLTLEISSEPDLKWNDRLCRQVIKNRKNL